MKLTIALILVLNFQVLANGYSQTKVTLNLKSVDFKKVISEIEKKTTYRFVFSERKIPKAKYVNVTADDQDALTVISQLLAGTTFTYQLLQNDLIAIVPQGVVISDINVTGKVLDQDNQPLIGATVKIKGTNQGGATTDANGVFTINAPENAVLVITYLGFDPQEIAINGRTSITVKMKEDSKQLNEVVVVGYGTMRKKDLTGSITQIRPDKIADQNPNTVQDILRGTPGVSVGLDPSAKGGGAIQIRGIRSIFTEGGRNTPLLVLDGSIYYGELSEINPDDIEQIDILKDASASAVYGSRAANGVIIVSTKKGKAGKPRINFTSNVGLAVKAADREVFGPDEYMRYRQDFYTAPTYGLNTATGKYEAYKTGPQATKPGFYDEPTEANLTKYGITLAQWRAYGGNAADSDNKLWAGRLAMEGPNLENYLANKTFDWYEHSFRTGLNQDYNLSASGASDQINYYMSIGYLNNQGMAKGNDYKTIRSNIKIDGKINDWLNLGANLNFQNRTDGDLAIDWNNQIVRNSPFANYKDPNGNLVARPMGDNSTNNFGYNYDYDRGFRDLERGFTIINTILNAQVKLPFNVTYSFNAAPRYEFFHDRYWESALHPNWGLNNGLVNREQSKKFDWSLINRINWEQTFATKHRVNVTLVQEAEKRSFWQDRMEGRNMTPTDVLGYHEIGVVDKQNLNTSLNSEDRQETADGMLARLHYSFDDRYMITTSFRRDGYSGFGAANRRANFFSAAIGWTFVNEKFFNWEPMSTGKLRVSWGQNGNRHLGNDPYRALGDLQLAGTGGYLDNNGNLIQVKAVEMRRLSNPNLTWEKTESFNLGLEFGFLKNRISGSFDYFITPTVDMIQSRELPGFTGFRNITTNLGKVENRGFEFSLNSRNISKNGFNWNTTFGISKYKNTIKHLQNIYDMVIDPQGNVEVKERDFPANGWFIGQPIGAIWDFRVTGMWQADEAVEAAKYGQRPGDPKVANNPINDVVNTNGTTTIRYGDEDKEFQGQTNPPVMWSMRNDFDYKNFNFSFNLYSYWGHKSLSNEYQNRDNRISLITNQANVYAKEYWTLDNPTNEFARLEAQGPSGASTPQRVYDKSFIRLENVTLGYTLPKIVANKLRVQNLKIYSSARNVAVWQKDKNWDYWDIETGQLAPRIYTFGLNANF
ncbi:MAG: SusC/RagA family TonB-linked outer membrane protein [Sphingobacteriaceae bacterium]|nr:SusC/RagA family TonB-linked outer membrane protein [Sphingobacteriaceae bacterium]